MKIRCLIIDDEPIACRGMEEYVSRIDFLELSGTCFNASEAYQILQVHPVDLIFADIEMPKISGVDFIRSLSVPPFVIFTTAYPNYALDGFDLGVADYLVKPFSFPRFLKAVTKVKDQLVLRAEGRTVSPAERGSFFVKENGRFLRVYYDEIVYVEALQNYVAIHLQDKKLITYLTLTLLENQLPPERFMKVHKSYIIALDKIKCVEGNIVTLASTQLPVSRNLKDALMQRVVDSKLIKR
jgi:two-component system, LytTR family, response regulator